MPSKPSRGDKDACTMPNDVNVMSASIEGFDVVVSTELGADKHEERFNIRRLTNFELRHDLENRDEVRVFLGYNDARGQAMEQKFLGKIRGLDKLKEIRETFDQVGIPVIEF
jgi:hypothetical protein